MSFKEGILASAQAGSFPLHFETTLLRVYFDPHTLTDDESFAAAA